MPRKKKHSDHPLVTVPWSRKDDMPRELVERAYETCKRGDKARCINTNWVRASAEYQGRSIRFPHTFKGDLHWSERVGGQWCRYVAPLTVKYAKLVDAFDHDAGHFKPPVTCPMGPVRFVGFSSDLVRADPRETRERKARMNARIKSGELVPGSRFRERQLPYAAKQNGAPDLEALV